MSAPPWILGLPASRAGREQVPLASSPQPVGTYSGPRTLVPGGAQAPRVCLEAHGCLELGLGETGRTPTSCRSSHLGLLLPRLSCHFPHSQGVLHPSWGPGHTVPPWGTGEGAQDSPRAAHPLGGAGGSLRDNLKVWTAAFPKALGSPRSTPKASTDQGSVRVSGSDEPRAFSPWKEASGSRNSGIQDPPSLRPLP